MPHPYDQLFSHMMMLDWQSRHEYLNVALLGASERMKTAVRSYVTSRMSPSDYICGLATGVKPPKHAAIPLKDAPKGYKKRQLTLPSMFDEQRRKAARTR